MVFFFSAFLSPETCSREDPVNSGRVAGFPSRQGRRMPLLRHGAPVTHVLDVNRQRNAFFTGCGLTPKIRRRPPSVKTLRRPPSFYSVIWPRPASVPSLSSIRCGTVKPTPGGAKPKGKNGSRNGPQNVPPPAGQGGRAGSGSGSVGGAGERPTIGEVKKRYAGFSDHVHQSLLVSAFAVVVVAWCLPEHPSVFVDFCHGVGAASFGSVCRLPPVRRNPCPGSPYFLSSS